MCSSWSSAIRNTHLKNSMGLLSTLIGSAEVSGGQVWCALKPSPNGVFNLKVQLQLEHCSSQGCHILAAAKENLT